MKLPFEKLRHLLLKRLFEISVMVYRPLFKGKTKPWRITQSELVLYPDKSLGKALYVFLKNHGFDIQSKLESHDVYHVLTETGTSVPEEISMQYCLVASGKKSIYSYITILLGTTIVPEKLPLYRSAYQMGKRMTNISKWDFESRLSLPLTQLQKEMYRSRVHE